MCHQLGQVTVLQYFWEMAGSMDHQHVCRQAWLLKKVLDTVITLFWQTVQVGEWQVIWCLRSHQIVHDVGSLCISTMWLSNFFLLERTLKQELQKWQMGPRWSLLSCPPAPPGCPGYPPHHSSSPPSPPPHYHPPSSPHHPPPCHPISGGLEGLKALPPLLQGPAGQALGFLHRGLASSSPRFQNNDMFEIIHKLQNCDSDFQMFVILKKIKEPM